MKSSTLKFIAATLVITASGISVANAQNLKPGQYEYTTKTEVFGISIPVNFKQCVTQTRCGLQ